MDGRNHDIANDPTDGGHLRGAMGGNEVTAPHTVDGCRPAGVMEFGTELGRFAVAPRCGGAEAVGVESDPRREAAVTR